MKAIIVRLEETIPELLDDEADEHGRTRSKHVREVMRTRHEHDRIRDEYEAKLASRPGAARGAYRAREHGRTSTVTRRTEGQRRCAHPHEWWLVGMDDGRE